MSRLLNLFDRTGHLFETRMDHIPRIGDTVDISWVAADGSRDKVPTTYVVKNVHFSFNASPDGTGYMEDDVGVELKKCTKPRKKK